MACGLKKQNTESGVHLTERTCSPYNPIIRLMVDDCLGLPIYPVTSVDAVIDEEGKTLRQLLQELSDLFGEGNVDIKDIKIKIEEIELALTFIENNYAQKTDLNDYVTSDTFDNLKKLVWAISALTDTTAAEHATLYENDGKTPKIVAAVLDLQNKLEQILGDGTSVGLSDIIELLVAVSNFDTNFNPNNTNFDDLNKDGRRLTIIDRILNIESSIGLTPGDDESLMDKIDALQRMQNALKALLLAIANYDERDNADDREDFGNLVDNLGFSSTNSGHIIEVIYRIATLGTRVQALEDLLGGGGSISDRIEELEKTSAHLDQFVLDLMPQNLQGPRKEIYLTLKIGEYPPDTVDMIDRNTINVRRAGLQRLEYYKELLETETASGEFIYDVYPFCHTDLDKGLPLYFRDSNNNYTPVVNGNGVQLRAGDGKINLRDVAQLIDISKGLIDDPLNLKIYKGSELLSILDESYIDGPSKIYGRLYWGSTVNSNEPALYGDVNTDGENGKNGDISAAIDYVISKKIAQLLNNPEIISLPSDHSLDSNFGYMFYYENNKLAPSAIYPCIEGKLYLDYFTKDIYQFSLDEMSLVNYPTFKAEGNIEINDTYSANYPKHRKIEFTVPEYTAGDGININLNKKVSVDEAYIMASSDDMFLPLIVSIIEENETKKCNIRLGKETNFVHKDRNSAQAGEYYVVDRELDVLRKPSGNTNSPNAYAIDDVSGLIDLLLKGSNGSVDISNKTKILNNIAREVSNKYSNATQEQLEVLNNIVAVLDSKYNNINLIGGTLVDVVNYVYLKSNNEYDVGVAYNQHYKNILIKFIGDIDEDGEVTIADVSYLIDVLLGNQESEPRTESLVLGKAVYKKGEGNQNSDIEIVPSIHAECKYKIFRTEVDNREVLYYFDETEAFVPVTSDYTLSIDHLTNTLTLNKDGVSHSFVSLVNTTKSVDTGSFVTNDTNVDVSGPVVLRVVKDNNGTSVDIIDDPDLTTLNHPNTNRIQVEGSKDGDSIFNYTIDAQDAIDGILDRIDSQEDKVDNISLITEVRYYDCIDLLFGKIKFVKQTTTAAYVDPEDISLGIVYTSIIKVLDSTDIDTDSTYYIKDSGTTVKYSRILGNLVPNIVSTERHLVLTACPYTVKVNEIADLTPANNQITLLLDKLTLVPNYKAIEIRGTFIADANGTALDIIQLKENGQPSTNFTFAYDVPAIISGSIYEYRIFNGYFTYLKIGEAT